MRWLVIHPGPSWSVHDVYQGWVEALRDLGEEVESYNLDDRIGLFDAALVETGTINTDGYPQVRKMLGPAETLQLATENILSVAMRWWPDVVLAVSAFFVPAFIFDVLRGRGIKVVLLHTESPYQDTEQLARAGHADLNLVNDPVNLAAYQAHGPAYYQPHCYRPKVHFPGTGSKDLDLVFVGTGFQSRRDFFTAMDLDGLYVGLGGGWPDLPPSSPLHRWLIDDDTAGGSTVESMRCTDNDVTAGLYRAAKCGINFYRREANDGDTAEGTATGPREIEMAACGLWFTRDPRPESDDLFPFLPAFGTPGEASEHIRWALAHDGTREKTAAAARKAVAGRTFEASARRLLTLVSK